MHDTQSNKVISTAMHITGCNRLVKPYYNWPISAESTPLHEDLCETAVGYIMSSQVRTSYIIYELSNIPTIKFKRDGS
jgi:hypothetical protein